MDLQHVAAIDIGSNAVRLLISSIQGQNGNLTIKKVILLRVPLRLGEDSFTQGKIGIGKEKNLIKLMKAYRHLMDIHGVEKYRACATSAMREASNGKRITRKVADKTGIDIEIVSGSEEARIIFESHISDQLDATKNYLFVDVGGGSTELTLIAKGNLIRSQSFNLGTVRSLNGKVKESERTAMNIYLDEIKNSYAPSAIIGSRGNINKLSRLSDDPGNKFISYNELLRLRNELSKLSIDERMVKFQLNPDRADVILPASDIFLNIAIQTDISDIIVPSFGVVDGLTYQLAHNDNNSK